MAKQSASILTYRRHNDRVEVFLVHPGGPFWAQKDKDVGAWSIPKGEISRNEETLETAKREFREETGIALNGAFVPLPPVEQSGGKVVHAYQPDPHEFISWVNQARELRRLVGEEDRRHVGAGCSP